MTELALRRLSKTPDVFVEGATFPSVRMKVLEGQDSTGVVDLKPLMIGDDMLLVEIFEQAGASVPFHSHDDHESIVYLIRGRMELVIGDKTFIAKSGDVWRHPIGVAHSSVALEDCVAVEIKSPPRKTWNPGG